eukprot:3363385-Heterocapsa_arctica.AAC.1
MGQLDLLVHSGHYPSFFAQVLAADTFPLVLGEVHQRIQNALTKEPLPEEVEIVLACPDARCRSVAVARLAHHCLRQDGWR